MEQRIIKFRAFEFRTKQMRNVMGFRINDDGCLTWNAVEPGNEKGWQPMVTNHPEYTQGVIMQFTGLLDKNGKEIYEGDIVIMKHPDKDKILAKFEIVIDFENDCVDGWRSEQLEVIGNIYENPELLKDEVTQKNKCNDLQKND
ncbi:MAG: YopX family protein, partial [Candidatus Paceibacterota bacterium]|jgi:uncharacterized phage protein (TIGR01671 family)